MLGLSWRSSGGDSALPRQGLGFNPWSGNSDPASHAVQPLQDPLPALKSHPPLPTVFRHGRASWCIAIPGSRPPRSPHHHSADPSAHSPRSARPDGTSLHRQREEAPWLCCEGFRQDGWALCPHSEAGPQEALTAPWLRPQSHLPAGVGALHLPPPWTPTGFQWTCELAPGGPCIFPGVGIQTLVTENAETGARHKKSKKPRPYQVPVRAKPRDPLLPAPPPGACGLGSGPELPSPWAQAHPGDSRVWAGGGGVGGGSAGQEGLEGRGALQACGAPRLLGVRGGFHMRPAPAPQRAAGQTLAGPGRGSPSLTRNRA